MAAKEDWFEKLAGELEKKKEEVMKDISTESEKRIELNRNLIEDFWRIWIQFNKINVHFKMIPSHDKWVSHFIEYPDKWVIKKDFDFARVWEVSLVDITRDSSRVGDSLKVLYYNADDGEKLRMVFEFSEGEKYDKYSGWKRIYSQYVLYDEYVKKASLDKIREILLKVIPVWYESHLKGDRSIIIDYIKKNFVKGKTFTD
jgi:hypothetical protein